MNLLISRNPATGEILQRFNMHSAAEVERRLELAQRAFQDFRKTTFQARSDLMKRVAQILEEDQERLSQLMTREMGKTIRSAREEIAKCALGCHYFAENAEKMLKSRSIPTQARSSYTLFQPLGPILAIMPWNFPFWQVIRFAAPALMAGNVALLKHASNVPECAITLENLFRRAGFAEGVFQTLLIPSSQVSSIISDRRVMAVTLTGSEKAGISVASEAGRCIKKSVLELGGSDPFIVTSHAKLPDAIRTALKARMINNGQSCIAAKRFVILAEVFEEFRKGFIAEAKALRMGDPFSETTDLGPLATEEILNGVDAQVRSSIQRGARVLLGAQKPDGPGFFYPATILESVPLDSEVFEQEVFGPVAPLIKAESVAHAIELANQTRFGLGSSVWTEDESEQERFIQELEAGQVFVNGMVASDPRLPFGGIKKSGYGRELSLEGIQEFVNIKTVWLK